MACMLFLPIVSKVFFVPSSSSPLLTGPSPSPAEAPTHPQPPPADSSVLCLSPPACIAPAAPSAQTTWTALAAPPSQITPAGSC